MRRQQGFTLVEMVVVAPMMMIVIAVILGYVLNIFLDTSAKNTKVLLQADAQSALFTLKDDIMFANFFQGTLPPGHNDPHKAGGWNAIDDNALMFTEVAYTANRQSSDRQLVYTANTPSPCGSDGQPEGNNYSLNTIILFVEDQTLYRRIIVPSQSNNCLSTYRRQTCPAAFATSACPGDSIMAEDVKEFDLTYYTNRVTWIAGSTETPVNKNLLREPARFVRVSRVDIDLTLERLVNGDPVSSTARISLKKANQ